MFVLHINSKKGVAVFKLEQSQSRPHYLKIDKKRQSFISVADRSVQSSIEVWEILKKSKNPRDVVFTYGRKEEILLKTLEEKQRISVREFSKIAKIPKFLASKTLVRLVLANVLLIHPQESDDYFTLKE